MRSFDWFDPGTALAKAAIIYVVFVCLITVPLSSGFTHAADIFHQGELMGNVWHMLAYYRGAEKFPLVIHGAMDYWPSVAAAYLYGPEYIVFGTRMIVLLTTFLSWILFVWAGAAILRVRGTPNVAAVAFVAVFLLTLPLRAPTVMSVEEAPVGLRDVFFLLLSTCVVHFYLSREKKLALLGAAFFLLPPTLLWSYDRGIAAALGCAALLGYQLVTKRYRQLAVALVALAVSLVLFELTRIGGSLEENVGNMLHWAKYSKEIWGVPYTPGIGGLAALLPLAFALLAFATMALLQWRGRSAVPLGLMALMLVAEVIMFKSAYNRPNIHRALMAAWPAVLPALWMLRPPTTTWAAAPGDVEAVRRGSYALPLVFAPLVLAVLYFATPDGKFAGFRESLRAPPKDREIAGAAMAQAADTLRGNPCVLNVVNQGVMTLLAGKTHCAGLPNMVYQSGENDAALVKELQRLGLQAVVVDSGDWSTNVDGRSMAGRLPALNAYLLQTYTKRTTIANYQVMEK